MQASIERRIWDKPGTFGIPVYWVIINGEDCEAFFKRRDAVAYLAERGFSEQSAIPVPIISK